MALDVSFDSTGDVILSPGGEPVICPPAGGCCESNPCAAVETPSGHKVWLGYVRVHFIDRYDLQGNFNQLKGVIAVELVFQVGALGNPVDDPLSAPYFGYYWLKEVDRITQTEGAQTQTDPADATSQTVIDGGENIYFETAAASSFQGPYAVNSASAGFRYFGNVHDLGFGATLNPHTDFLWVRDDPSVRLSAAERQSLLEEGMGPDDATVSTLVIDTMGGFTFAARADADDSLRAIGTRDFYNNFADPILPEYAEWGSAGGGRVNFTWASGGSPIVRIASGDGYPWRSSRLRSWSLWRNIADAPTSLFVMIRGTQLDHDYICYPSHQAFPDSNVSVGHYTTGCGGIGGYWHGDSIPQGVSFALAGFAPVITKSDALASFITPSTKLASVLGRFNVTAENLAATYHDGTRGTFSGHSTAKMETHLTLDCSPALGLTAIDPMGEKFFSFIAAVVVLPWGRIGFEQFGAHSLDQAAVVEYRLKRHPESTLPPDDPAARYVLGSEYPELFGQWRQATSGPNAGYWEPPDHDWLASAIVELFAAGQFERTRAEAQVDLVQRNVIRAIGADDEGWARYLGTLDASGARLDSISV